MILDTSEKMDIRNGYVLREESRGRSPKGLRLGFLVLSGLGMMIFLLSGCGSDSAPKGSASQKKERAAKSGSSMPAVAPLLSSKEAGTAPPSAQVVKIPGMPPPEELEAKRAAAAKVYEKFDPKRQVLPGLTKEQLEAKLEAKRAQKPDFPQKILPGLTPEQLAAKLKAHREQPTTPGEIMPGLTEEQVKAKAAQARQLQETGNTRPEQVFPPKSK